MIHLLGECLSDTGTTIKLFKNEHLKLRLTHVFRFLFYLFPSLIEVSEHNKTDEVETNGQG